MLQSLKNHIETTKHKLFVLYYCLKFSFKLLKRSIKHDLSKYSRKESRLFTKYVPKLRGCTYGSDEYMGFLHGLKPSLEQHYRINQHHPEHHNNFKNMSGLDRIEMIIDWLAATKRHADGDIYKSIEINMKRFGYNEDDKEWLTKIMEEVK